MLPALTLVVACYTTLRFCEVLSAENTSGAMRFVAGCLFLLSFVSCSVATFGGAGATP